MSAKHPSRAINVRFRPADYLRIRNASLTLEITPARFLRALILSAMEYYDREHPGEALRIEAVIIDRRRAAPLDLTPQERQARSRRRTAANKARVADIPPEFMDDYRRLRKRIPADAARMIIEKRMEERASSAKAIKRQRRIDAARERAADPAYWSKTLMLGRDAWKRRVIDIPIERKSEYRRLQQLFGASEAKRMIGEEVKRGRRG